MIAGTACALGVAMPRFLSRALYLSLSGGFSLVPSLAAAQDPTAKASAVQLFDEADRLMAQGQISAACPKYAASAKLDPQLGVLLHLADCFAQNGQVASAWASFRDAEEMARARGDDRAGLAHDRAKALEPKLSRLTVTVRTAADLPGLEVRVDGAPLTAGAWGVATPIDSGSHGVEARAPGYEAWSSSVDVTGEAQDVQVQVPLLTKAATSAPVPAGTSRNAAPLRINDSGAPLRTLGFASAGVGLVSLGVGGVMLVRRNGKLDERKTVCPILDEQHCSPAQEDSMNTLANEANAAGRLSTVAFVAGGALLAGGIAAIFLAPKPKQRTDAAWLLPVVGPGSIGLSGGKTW
jgi:hypothetical protein